MQKNWVDFRAIKDVVTIKMVLDHYGIQLRRSGDELRGKCPLHKGEGDRTFHASVSKNAFNCFSCGAHGNILDLVAAMEQGTIRQAALKLKDWFSISIQVSAEGLEQRQPKQPKRATEKEGASGENKPLEFELKGIDPAHPYLTTRGINREIAERFGVGYFSGRGSMAGRIVIPIHNPKGELVAYAGRSIDGSEPRYNLPAGFHKSRELFNFHRTVKEIEEGRAVVLVEGYFGCIKVEQAGFPALALMGSSMSDEQEELLVSAFDRVLLFLDGDDAGRAGTDEVSNRLKRKMFVKVAELEDGKQPDQLNVDEIMRLLDV